MINKIRKEGTGMMKETRRGGMINKIRSKNGASN